MPVTLADLREATPENWKELYKKAEEEDIYTLAANFDGGLRGGQTIVGLRAKHELRRRDKREARIDVWIERGITIFLALAAIVVSENLI